MVDYRWRLADVEQSGASKGRTVVSPTGSLIRVGLNADQPAFENAFINVLNERRPH